MTPVLLHYVYTCTMHKYKGKSKGTPIVLCTLINEAESPHKASSRLPLLYAMLMVTFLASDHHCAWLVTIYITYITCLGSLHKSGMEWPVTCML